MKSQLLRKTVLLRTLLLSLVLGLSSPLVTSCKPTVNESEAFAVDVPKLLTELKTKIAEAKKQQRTKLQSSPELFKPVAEKLLLALNAPAMQKKLKSSAVLKAWHTQITTSLKHIGFSYEMGHKQYIHDYVVKGPYPFQPSIDVLEKSIDFLRASNLELPASKVKKETEASLKEKFAALEARQKAFVTDIINNPVDRYENYKQRLNKEGENAAFPEFKDLVEYLELSLQKTDTKDPYLEQYKKIAFDELGTVSAENYPYLKTISATQRVLEFLDIFERGKLNSKDGKLPPLYHSDRYEYYVHFLHGEVKNHVMFPTFYSLGATDLLKTRGVPIGFIGVPTETSWVDGFTQTPLDFGTTDINHTRRMWQFFKEHAIKKKIGISEFAKKSTDYVQEKLIPLLKIPATDTEIQKNTKRMMKLVLFEVLHEDALPADPEVIKEALMRAPNTLTPFEEIIGGNKKVRYLMEPGATTLSYVYRKTAGNFYDMEGMRMEHIVGANFRNQDFIASSTKELSNKLGYGLSGSLIDTYVRDDTGLPDDFRKQLEMQLQKDPTKMAPLAMKKDVPIIDAGSLEEIENIRAASSFVAIGGSEGELAKAIEKYGKQKSQDVVDLMRSYKLDVKQVEEVIERINKNDKFIRAHGEESASAVEILKDVIRVEAPKVKAKH